MKSIAKLTDILKGYQRQHTVSRSLGHPPVASVTSVDTLLSLSSKSHILEASQAKLRCYRAQQSEALFSMAVQSEDNIERLHLPQVRRVDLCHEFDASPGDQLSFNFMTILSSDAGKPGHAAQTEIWLANLDTQQTTVLLSRSLSRLYVPAQQASKDIEHLQYPIETGGRYQLQFIQKLSNTQTYARNHLWINFAQVNRQNGSQPKQLPSLSSFGATHTKSK